MKKLDKINFEDLITGFQENNKSDSEKIKDKILKIERQISSTYILYEKNPNLISDDLALSLRKLKDVSSNLKNLENDKIFKNEIVENLNDESNSKYKEVNFLINEIIDNEKIKKKLIFKKLFKLKIKTKKLEKGLSLIIFFIILASFLLLHNLFLYDFFAIMVVLIVLIYSQNKLVDSYYKKKFFKYCKSLNFSYISANEINYITKKENFFISSIYRKEDLWSMAKKLM